MAENGPMINDDGTDYLSANEWSWNKKVSMLYIELPGGVGFSTCDPKFGECSFNDEIATNDNVPALLNWFEKYGDFKTNDFYFSGESYAGVYIPFTVKKLL
jgi:serine carboxypeptidase-like clade 2